MISKLNFLSIIRNLVIFAFNFITSLIIIRNLGSSKFYSEFIIFSSYGATFLFLSGALKETILYCNKGNLHFLYAVNQKILFYKKRIISYLTILFVIVLFLVNLLVPDPLISLLICTHIFSFYISETIQFTAVLTDQVADVINFRLFTSFFVMIITWISLQFGFNFILYFNILLNTLMPLFFYLRIYRVPVSINPKYLIFEFDYKLFILLSFQYFLASTFTFFERYLFSKSTEDLNSYSITIGLVQNLSAIFLSYLTMKYYSMFIKENHSEISIFRNALFIFLILFPFCLMVAIQNEPFIQLLFDSQNNSKGFLSDVSSSLGITIWAIPAIAIQTMIARYLMSLDKIYVFIKTALVTSIFGILLIGAAYLLNYHSYLRYCWMISQNIGLIVMIILGLNKSFSINLFKVFLPPFILLLITGICVQFMFSASNFIFNSIEILLYFLMSFLCIWFFFKKFNLN